MAAHASDWGDSLNQCHRGGKRVTMVMIFVGGVVFDVRQISCTIPTVQYLRGGNFFVPARTLIAVKLLKDVLYKNSFTITGSELLAIC